MRITEKGFFKEDKKYIELDILNAGLLTINHVDVWTVKNGTLINKEGEAITDNYKLLDVIFWEFMELKDRLFYDTERQHLITIKSLEFEYEELDDIFKIGFFENLENYIKEGLESKALIEIK